MTIKGHLLSSTGTVKLFQTENNLVHPSDRFLLPLEFRKCGDGKLGLWGYKAEKKIVRFDTMPACDRQTDRHTDSQGTIAITALCRASRA